MTMQEAFEKMLYHLSDEVGDGVLTAGEIHPDIPTIHEVSHRDGARLKVDREVRHAGWGLFIGHAAGDDISFDAGGAMRNVQDDQGKHLFSWTPLRFHNPRQAEAMGYDKVAARRAVEMMASGAFPADLWDHDGTLRR